MNRLDRVAGRCLACAFATGLAATALPALADTFTVTFPAGEACAFELQVDGSGGDKQHYREFEDKDGNVVRTFSGGVGYDLVFTNNATGDSLTLKGNGAVTQTTFNSDGTSTVVSTGHNILFLFPTDDPPGPSTTLYVGRIVFTIDASGNFTLLSTSGKSVDICAALSD